MEMNLPDKEGTVLWGLMHCCKGSAAPSTAASLVPRILP